MIGSLLEKMFVSVGVDLSGFKEELSSASRDVGKLSNEMKQKFEDIGKSWQNTGKKMMKTGAVMSGAVTAPLVLLGKGMTKAAIDAEEMQSAFNVVFGEMADDARAWAETTGNAMGRSTQEMQRGALAFQELFGKALDPKKATEMSKEFAVLTQDLASFKNLSNEVAQQKLFAGLTGEAEPLKALGVFINESVIKAKALEMGLGGANGKLTEQEKILVRAAAIREQLAQAEGDVMRTSESTANQIKKSEAAWEELSITVGTILIPALTPLITMVADVLEGFNQLDPSTQSFIVGAVAIAAVLGPVVTAIGAMVTGVGLLIPALAAAMPVLAAIGGFLTAMLLSPLGLVVLAIAAVVAAFVYWDDIVAIVEKVGAVISNWYGANVKPTVDKAAKMFLWLADMTIGNMMRLHNGVRMWLVDKLGAVFNWVKGKLEAVGGWFFDLYDKVVGNSYIPDMVERIGQEMAKLQTLMVDPAKKATESTKEAFRTLASSTESLLSRLFPVQAQIKSIMDDLSALDKALAAKLISPETYKAGRKTLLDEKSKAQMEAAQGQKVGGEISAVSNNEAMRQLAGIIGELPPLATEAQIALEGFGQRLGDDIMRGIYGVLTGRSSFKDFLSNTLEGFLNDIIGNALSNLEQAVFGKGGFGGFLGNVFTSLISGGARAVGGPVLPGRAYDVGLGEKFVPSQSGRILSRNDAMRAAGGGSGVPLNLTVKVSGARGNQEIMDMVAAGVKQGIGQYDAVIGKQVDNNFTRRG